MEDRLAERYGTRGRLSRRVWTILVVLICLLGLAWLVWVIWFQSTPDAQSSLRSFEVLDDHTVRAVVIVTTRSPQVEANCRLRAVARDHAVVGERNFEVTGVEERVERTVTFRTERAATAVELVGCTSDRQPRPR